MTLADWVPRLEGAATPLVLLLLAMALLLTDARTTSRLQRTPVSYTHLTLPTTERV